MRTFYSFMHEDADQHTLQAMPGLPGYEGALLTGRGNREENQDAIAYGLAADNSLVFCVADGLGGHNGGRAAARAAVSGVMEACAAAEFDALNTQSLMSVFAQAHTRIVHAQSRDKTLANMRSTLVVLALKNNQALWGHIGDVRLYWLRDSRPLARTKDQSVPQLLVEMGEITEHDIRGHPDRNRILHTLGAPQGDIQPVIAESPITYAPRDVFLLASDGFWESVPEEQLCTLAAHSAPVHALAQAERTYVHKPSCEEEQDNYAAILVKAAHHKTPCGIMYKLIKKLIA